MLSDDLFMAPYDPKWAIKFDDGSSKLKNLLGEHLVEVYHIGSTSIPNLCAKPIIDMIPVVNMFSDQDKWMAILIKHGYKYVDKWNKAMPFRRLFVRHQNNDFSDKVIEHLHIVEKGHRFIDRHLLFRDYLRELEDDKIAYCEIKKKIVNSGIPRKDYNEMKNEFIHSIDRKAYMWKYGDELPSDYYENN
ncbi:MAG: GrpB family protein [Candidatus Heimdallarchaeota archaeon]|nr:GrpB family protein [Candidatus Heimdallarchaeota archaeon]